MTEPGNSRLLAPEEAAELLVVTPRQVLALARAGELPCVKVGRFVRFRRESLDRWVEESEREARHA
jgi:excisionase family DNA binding protein